MFCQMLPSVACDSATRSATPSTRSQQGRVRRLQRHVGAAAHGDADGSRGERRRVVDAVADHGDRALLLQPADLGQLGVGQQLALGFEPELPAMAFACAWLSPDSISDLSPRSRAA